MRKYLVAFSHVLFLSSLFPELPTKPRCMKTQKILAHGVGHDVDFLCSDRFPSVRLPGTFDCLIFVSRQNLQPHPLRTLISDFLKVPSRVSSSPDVALSADTLSSVPRTCQYKNGLYKVIYTHGGAGRGNPAVSPKDWSLQRDCGLVSCIGGQSMVVMAHGPSHELFQESGHSKRTRVLMERYICLSYIKQ